MPGEDDLPSGLKELSYRHAVEVRSGRDFEHDVGRMIKGIEKLIQLKRSLHGETPSRQELVSRSATTMTKEDRPTPTNPKPTQQPQHDKSDPIQVQCPNGHRHTASESSRGKGAKCPTCSTPFVVPRSGEQARRIAENPPATTVQPLEVITLAASIFSFG